MGKSAQVRAPRFRRVRLRHMRKTLDYAPEARFPPAADGNVVSPPSSTSDLRDNAACQPGGDAASVANPGHAQVHQHRCDALPSVLDVEGVVEVVIVRLASPGPGVRRSTTGGECGMGCKPPRIFDCSRISAPVSPRHGLSNAAPPAQCTGPGRAYPFITHQPAPWRTQRCAPQCG